MAVVGEMGGGEKREQLALGETPNLAARLQSAAAPDTIVVSAATHRLIQGFFVCEALGAQHLKGVDKAIGIYRVNQESSAMSRHDVVLKLTPFIGRQQELAELLAHWHRAREGAGQVVLLSGEAGIGKSRLRQEFAERIRGEPHAFIRCRCSPYHQSAAFYPVIDMLERQLKFAREDSSGQKLNKLTEMLAPYSLKQSEILPAFSRLLAIPFDDHDHAASPELQKQQTLQAVLSLLLAMAAKQPLCFVMDDLHWADSATLEMLSLLIPQVSPVRLFCLFSFRPAFQPPWGDHLHVRQITLAHLSRDETAQMIKKIVFDKTLPSAVLAQLVSKTDGVPLFVEELTKTVLELGLLEEQAGRYELTAPLPSVTIPATLYDSLMARLDRLAIAKEVAQIGATIGRDFDYEILRAVSPFDEISLQRELLRLVEAGLLYQKDAQYKFKHALIRDAAYDSLLKSKRRQYHQQIAQVLATRCREMTESHTALVAYHQAAVKINEPVIPGQ
jgi:predicted ATPase